MFVGEVGVVEIEAVVEVCAVDSVAWVEDIVVDKWTGEETKAVCPGAKS